LRFNRRHTPPESSEVSQFPEPFDLFDIEEPLFTPGVTGLLLDPLANLSAKLLGQRGCRLTEIVRLSRIGHEVVDFGVAVGRYDSLHSAVSSNREKVGTLLVGTRSVIAAALNLVSLGELNRHPGKQVNFFDAVRQR